MNTNNNVSYSSIQEAWEAPFQNQENDLKVYKTQPLLLEGLLEWHLACFFPWRMRD